MNPFDAENVRADLVKHGYSHVTGLPPDFDLVSAMSAIGRPIPQYDGALIRHIRPEPGMSDDVYSATNTRELTPHTEWYEFPGIPPRHVALWCVQPAADEGGATQLGDGYRFLERFTRAELARLHTGRPSWRSNVSLRRHGVDTTSESPILTGHDGVTIIRFSSVDMRAADPLQERYLTEGQAFFHATALSFKIPKHGLLVWDNWRMLHARTAFTDRRRHLQRVLLAATEV
jgi:hypothetical protein